MIIPEIELIFREDSVEVCYKYTTVFSFGVTAEDKVFLRGHNPDRLELREHSPLPHEKKKVDYYTIVPEPKQTGMTMALPKLTKEPVRNRAIPAGRATRKNQSGSGSTDHISEGQRDQILTALLDSLLDVPRQTIKFRASETHRIAERFNEPLYAVAGVRATLTKGGYGPQTELLKRRLAARRRTERMASGQS